MASSQGRSVWRPIFDNFLKSLRLLPPRGKIVGEDNLGNCYYEAPKNPDSARNSPIRWFVPKIKDDWQQDLPAEWEAWLRGRRRDPPTIEEIARNAAIAQMKKIKGAELEAKAAEQRTKLIGGPAASEPVKAFPTYEEYDKMA